MLQSVYYGYRESSWERLINYISKEIENNNEQEIKNGIDHVRENYSDFYDGGYIAPKFQSKIKSNINSKTKKEDLTKR